MGVEITWCCDRCQGKAPGRPNAPMGESRMPLTWKNIRDPRMKEGDPFSEIQLCPPCHYIINQAAKEAETLKYECINNAFIIRIDVEEREKFRKSVANG